MILIKDFIDNKKLFLFGGFFIGSFLRLIDIKYGLPYLYHPDEVRQILDTLSMAQRVSPIPADHTYPAMHKYVLLFLYGIYYVTGRLLGFFSNPTGFALAFLQDPSILFLIGRLTSVAFGMGVGLIIYKLGKAVFGQKSAFIAAMFSLFMYQLVSHSQWAIADIMVAFIVTTAFLLIFLDMTSLSNKYFYLASIFIGLGISTKFHGVFMVLPLAVGQGYLLYENKGRFNWFLKRFIVGMLLILAFSLLGNLALFTDTTAFIGKFKQLSGVAKIGLSSAPAFNDGFFGLLLWFSKEMVRQEMLIGVFVLLGMGYSLWRHDKYDILCLSYLLILFVFFSDWGFRYLHLFTPAFGIMCILAGRFISDLLDRMKFKGARAVIYTVLFITLTLSIIWRGVDAGLQKLGDDTRMLAKYWIEKNIQAGSRIGIDWYEFGPPLFDDIPVVVHSPTAGKFYISNTPEEIKNGYEKFLGDNKNLKKYRITNLMYATPEPVWPLDMPVEARKRAEGIEAFRDLYSWFNFMSPAEIYQHQVEYVVLSSYAYSHFLLDSDKRKTGLFNPYIYEDMVNCIKQAEAYDNKTLQGLLFFLTKRARDFYLGFLDGGMRAKLIKEFVPTPENMGPIIKVYKLEK